jgi:hypothetical protein
MLEHWTGVDSAAMVTGYGHWYLHFSLCYSYGKDHTGGKHAWNERGVPGAHGFMNRCDMRHCAPTSTWDTYLWN